MHRLRFIARTEPPTSAALLNSAATREALHRSATVELACLAEILREHRARLEAAKVDKGWLFPSDAGTLRTPNSLDRPLAKCLDARR